MLKIVLVAITCGIIVLTIKSYNSEYALLALIASSIILIFYSLNVISETYQKFIELLNNSSIDYSMLKIILKITIIGYLVEFSSSILEDFGLSTLSNKLVFIGKVIILAQSFPIILSIYNVIVNLK